MIEKLTKIRDKKGIFAAVQTDLSKAFDYTPYNLLIAKVSAYGFDRKPLIFISPYLKSRKQKARIGPAFKDYWNILLGVPQGSILGPILFIIFLFDLFYSYNDLDYAGYADDTTPCVSRQNYAEPIGFLEPIINNIFGCFKNNGLVANSGESHFLISPYEKIILKILGFAVGSSPCEELLGITIDSELTIYKHVISLCSKDNQNLALAKIAKCLTTDKRKILLNSFIMAQFNYCPLTWMCHSRALNSKINRMQERALRIVYNDYKPNFKELLEGDHSFTVHERSIHYIAIEACKVKNGLSPVIMNDIFQFSKSCAYELRSGNHLQITNTSTVNFGSEFIKTLGAKIWDLTPEEIKASKYLIMFKKKTKNWTQKKSCPCLLCRIYVSWFHKLTFTFLASPTTCCKM